MTDEPRAYRAIFFDLDGTLLPMDLDEFLNAYFKTLITYAATNGYDPDKFKMALMAGTKAMMDQDGVKNEDCFWATFYQLYGVEEEQKEATKGLFEAFYAGPFSKVGEGVAVNPITRRALETLKAKGYPLVLATMPLFPRIAVEERLTWAGLDASLFEHITTYENSTSVKPKLDYYREVLAAVGANAADVCMVGNNTLEDLSSMELGLDAFLITDHILNPNDFDVETVRHGSMEDFAAWVDQLPDCQ